MCVSAINAFNSLIVMIQPAENSRYTFFNPSLRDFHQPEPIYLYFIVLLFLCILFLTFIYPVLLFAVSVKVTKYCADPAPYGFS